MRSLFIIAIAVATAGPAALVTTSAHGQSFTIGYQFLEAIRDRDGTKVTELLGEPGTTVVNTREPATGRTALHIVVERRDLVWLRFLLARGADAGIADRAGLSPLMVAAQLGWSEGASALIAARANVNQENNRGETALHAAVERRDIALVRMLVAAGANPDAQDSVAGMSPRDYATRDSRSSAILSALEAPRAAPVAAPVLVPPAAPAPAARPN
jgi:uncharacterized protein